MHQSTKLLQNWKPVFLRLKCTLMNGMKGIIIFEDAHERLEQYAIAEDVPLSVAASVLIMQALKAHKALLIKGQLNGHPDRAAIERFLM